MRAVEQMCPVFILCFSYFATKEKSKLFVLTPRGKSCGKCSSYLHIRTSVIGAGYPNNMSEHFSKAETEKFAVSPEDFRL